MEKSREREKNLPRASKGGGFGQKVWRVNNARGGTNVSF